MCSSPGLRRAVPLARAGQPRDEEGVGSTSPSRARKALTILYTKSRVIYGRTEFCTPCVSGRDSRRPSGKGDGQTHPSSPTAGRRGHRAAVRPAARAERSTSPSRSAAGSTIRFFGGGASSSRRGDMGNDTLLEVEFFSGQTKN